MRSGGRGRVCEIQLSLNAVIPPSLPRRPNSQKNPSIDRRWRRGRASSVLFCLVPSCWGQMQGGLRASAKRLAVPRFPRVQTRRMAGEAGAREKLLLEEDPALKEFRSQKAILKRIKRFGDVLVLAVVAGGVYEIYWHVEARKAARVHEVTSGTV